MKPSNDDTDLIAGLKTGNEKALDALFTQLYRPLVYFALRIIKSREEAEDIAVDAFSKLWNRRMGFESYAALKAFLYLTVRNACLDYLRQLKRAPASSEDLTVLMQEDAFEAEQIQAELLQKIYEEMEKLPKQCRQVFKLSVLDGLKSKEIASHMRISVTNVTSQKTRAVLLLRTALLKKFLTTFLSPFL